MSKVLKEFEKVGILDKYGVYQLFKDYYNEVLQDDWFLISFNGFRSAKELRKLNPLKDKNKKANYLEEPDFIIQKTYYKSDLIPKHLIKQRFFEKETKELEELENALNEKEALLDEFIEEHSNEEGLFDGLKINESVLKKELKNATDPEDEKILKTALEWLEAKNKALKMKNKAYEELELKAFHQYKNLEINEIKDLIIKDKWLNSLKNALENKIQKRINAFISALNEIISSYSNSLLELDKEVKESESKVLEHLKDLGVNGVVGRMDALTTPSNWQKVRLGDIAEIKRGVRITKNELDVFGKYPVVSGGVGFLGYTNNFNRYENTITIAQYGTAGYVNFQKNKFWANDVCFCVYPNKDVIKNIFLYYFLKVNQNYLYEISNRNATPYSISKDKILDFEILLPPLNEQIAIANILSDLDSEITSLKNKKRQFENIKKALNHDLMSAKIRVLNK
ncbi:hypothetical protein DR8_23490 [Helicobacter pylori]